MTVMELINRLSALPAYAEVQTEIAVYDAALHAHGDLQVCEAQLADPNADPVVIIGGFAGESLR